VVRFPESTGLRLSPGNVIVMKIRYSSNASTAQADRTALRLQFAASPVARLGQVLPIANTEFAIPPMTRDADAGVTSAPTAEPLLLWGALPQLRRQGKAVKLALGAGQCLLNIPRWNEGWQQLYFFSSPVALPAGSTFQLECSWSNNGATPLRWGDELCLEYVYVTPP
jgi:hypothetical protein